MTASSSINSVLALIGSYKSDQAMLIKQLDQLNLEGLSESEVETWYYYRGILELKSNRREQAMAFLQKGKQLFPDSGAINFSLGIEYEAKGRKVEMADCFSHVKLDNAMPSVFFLVIHLLYLWGFSDAALLKIESALDLYFEFDSVDDIHIRQVGLPSVLYALRYYFCFCQLMSRMEWAQVMLNRFASEFRSYSFEEDRLRLDAIMKQKWSPLIRYLDDQKILSAQLNAVIFCSQQEANQSHALEMLEAFEPELSDKFLHDIQNYALAEYSHRVRNLKMEQEFLALFLNQQPMLLDPNYTFLYGFVSYQERVKRIYQDFVTAGHENPLLLSKSIAFAFEGLPLA